MRLNWLPHYLTQAGLSQAELARRVGVARQNISNYMRAVALDPEVAERLAPHLGVEAAQLVFGPEYKYQTAIPAQQKVAFVPIRGQAGAGLWREGDVTADVEGAYDGYDSIGGKVPAVPGRFGVVDQFAYQIVGSSANKLRIEDGDFVICVPFHVARVHPATGDIVIVERDRGGLIETTCKQVEVKDDATELWPRSTDPRFQEPIRIPRGRQRDAEGFEIGSDDVIIRIVGLVIGRYSPL